MKPEEVPQKAVDACKVAVEHHELIHDDSDTGYCDDCLRLKLSAAFPALLNAALAGLSAAQISYLGATFRDGSVVDDSDAREWRESVLLAVGVVKAR